MPPQTNSSKATQKLDAPPKDSPEQTPNSVRVKHSADLPAPLVLAKEPPPPSGPLKQVDYPDEQNPFAEELTEEQETKRSPKIDPVKERPETKTTELKPKPEPEPEPETNNTNNNKTEYVESDIALKQSEIIPATPPPPAAQNQAASPAPDLNRATKAVVSYYDDANNLINEFSLVKSAASDKLESAFSFDSNPTAVETTTNETTTLFTTEPLKFIDDSFELVDEEAQANLEALQRQQDLANAESLNYVAETYYKSELICYEAGFELESGVGQSRRLKKYGHFVCWMRRDTVL